MGEEPPVELEARIAAEELEFREDPEVSSEADSVESERANLPDKVRRKVRYRTVRVNTRMKTEITESGRLARR